MFYFINAKTVNMAYCVDDKNEVFCKTMHLSKHLIKYLLSFKLCPDLDLIMFTILMPRINVSLLLFVSNSFTWNGTDEGK